MNIRKETTTDEETVRALVLVAFGQPDEETLVNALRNAGRMSISHVGEKNGAVLGHILAVGSAALTSGTLFRHAPEFSRVT
jgi:predicted N-acetyltransferase YhbS